MSQSKARPTLFLVVGPNGAGKSTFVETVLKGRVAAPFINADLIQRDELRDSSMKASYEAARVAATRRQALIDAGQSFIAETVFSHESKLDLIRAARAAGFRIVLFHLDVESADVAVARVRSRVREGGHPVPESKVRSRYARNKRLIRQAAISADVAVIFDSSARNRAPTPLARFRGGRMETLAEDPPAWFTVLYGDLSP